MQGDDGVDGGGTAGGQVAGGQRDSDQDQSDGGEGGRVVGCDTEKLAGHEAGEAEGQGDAEGDAGEGHGCTLTEDEAEDIGALRA